MLSRLQSRRAVRAIATMIRDNLVQFVIGHNVKLGAGLVHAQTVGSGGLEAELQALSAMDLPDSPALTLARAISPSPAQVDDGVVEAAGDIPPAGIVELVSFIALLQVLHRLSSFFTPVTP